MRVLLEGGERLLDGILAGRGLARTALTLSLVMVAGSALYGAVFGSWHGARLAGFVAVKLPLVLVATAALTLLFTWIALRLLGLPLRLGQVAVLTLLGLAVASLVLGALSPAALLFVQTSPPPSGTARTAHNVLYLLHTGLIGAAGFAGTRPLKAALGRLEAPRATLRLAYAIWIFAYALVGGEVGWAFRPFVGSVYAPVEFLREHPLDGNLYEFVVTDILPHLGERLVHGLDGPSGRKNDG